MLRIIKDGDSGTVLIIHTDHFFLPRDRIQKQHAAVYGRGHIGATEGELGLGELHFRSFDPRADCHDFVRDLVQLLRYLGHSGLRRINLCESPLVVIADRHALVFRDHISAEPLVTAQLIGGLSGVRLRDSERCPLHFHLLHGDLGAGAVGVKRGFHIGEPGGHGVPLKAAVDGDQVGQHLTLFHQLALQHFDFINDSIGEGGGLDRERIRLDPAGSLEKKGARFCGSVRRDGPTSDFLLNPDSRDNLDRHGEQEPVAEQDAEQQPETQEYRQGQEPNAEMSSSWRSRGFRPLDKLI